MKHLKKNISQLASKKSKVDEESAVKKNDIEEMKGETEGKVRTM